MATNLAIDPALLDQALALSGERTKKAAVTMALQEFIARREQRRVLELMGKLDWDDTYDYKVERSRSCSRIATTISRPPGCETSAGTPAFNWAPWMP